MLLELGLDEEYQRYDVLLKLNHSRITDFYNIYVQNYHHVFLNMAHNDLMKCVINLKTLHLLNKEKNYCTRSS